MGRETGYYWVKYRGEWYVGYWSGKDQWVIIAYQHAAGYDTLTGNQVEWGDKVERKIPDGYYWARFVNGVDIQPIQIEGNEVWAMADVTEYELDDVVILGPIKPHGESHE